VYNEVLVFPADDALISHNHILECFCFGWVKRKFAKGSSY